MKKGELVAVAMSGGVDSSVAALLLKQQGYQIVGLTMQLVPCGGEKRSGCCGIEAVRLAQRVCQRLRAPHYVVNFREPFKKSVIKNFIQEYGRGYTPNPCVVCNEKIKFDLLLRRAKEIGAAYLTTGHYATIKSSGQELCLFKGKDKNKDQSYFLYRLDQEQLKYLLFPLGNLTKPQVRQIALKNKLDSAKRPESQEICFIPDNNYRQFLLNNGLTNKPGQIIDKNKKVIGQHEGLFNYTIGQRKGLGISGSKPLYVIKNDIKKNQLVVGLEKDLYQKKCLIKNITWISGSAPKLPLSISAKIRYRSPEAPATLKKQGQKLICQFIKPQRAITPGQSIVFYLPRGHRASLGGLPRGRMATLRGQGEQVIGGGIIADLD
jgi:tRNA-uridine 2-sulfurtransferase